MKVLEVKNVWKSYGEHEVLQDIHFSINKQDMFAILGVNGAGKTTLLESIEGLRTFDKGEIHFPNGDTFGVQLQSSTLPENIKVQEIIELMCAWNNIQNSDAYLHYFGLRQMSNQTYKTLSTGQMRKLHLILALISGGDILFLDEPTAGLDVEARAEFHTLLKELNKNGKTIIFSSHDMSEVESLCNRMIFLKNKKVAFYGTVEEFKNSISKTYKVKIRTSEQVTYEEHDLQDITNELFDLIKHYKDNHITIQDIKIEQPSLEDVFLQYAEEEYK